MLCIPCDESDMLTSARTKAESGQVKWVRPLILTTPTVLEFPVCRRLRNLPSLATPTARTRLPTLFSLAILRPTSALRPWNRLNPLMFSELNLCPAQCGVA